MSTVLFQSQSSPPQFWGCVGGKGGHARDSGEEGRVWGRREREESVDEKRGDKGRGWMGKKERRRKRRKDWEEGEDSMD